MAFSSAVYGHAVYGSAVYGRIVIAALAVIPIESLGFTARPGPNSTMTLVIPRGKALPGLSVV